MAKAKGEIEINENCCLGCGFCVEFCSRGCIEMTDKLSLLGLPLPAVTAPEKCNACGICGCMCPHLAIEVYKYSEDTPATAV